MAITQKSGALANAGAQAQSIANTLSNAAANLHYAPQPQRSYGQEPVYQPAPVYRAPQQQGSFTSGGSAAAAQHILTQARNQQVARQNVFNDVAKQAVMTALAVATGQQPGRQFTPPPTLLQRQATGAQQHQLTPQQESQLFDQQIQATRLGASQQGMPGVFTPDSATQQRITGINSNIDTMRSGFLNARPNPRLTQEGQVLAAFPQMTPQELRPRSNDQLAAMLGLAQQPPASAAGSGDQVGGGVAPSGEMTHNQPPKGPPPQPALSLLPSWDTTRGAPAQPPYSPLPTGAAQVSAAFTDALNRGSVVQQTQGGQMADGGGGILGAIKDVGGSLIGGLWGGIKGFASAFKDAAAGGYESLLGTEVGQQLVTGLEALDWARTKNVEIAGEQAYGAASGDWKDDTGGRITSRLPGGEYIDASPDTLLWLAMFEADSGLQGVVTDAYENGYSSPSYIKVAEAQGVDWHSTPQFTGGRAVWEAAMGYATDDKPFVVKYGVRMLADVIYDPLTYLPLAGEAGKGLGGFGHALSLLDEAGAGTKVIGKTLEVVGKTGELAARAPDLPVEGLLRGGGKVGGRIGEVTGLFSPSMTGRREAAVVETAALDDALKGAREAVPEGDGRRYFDAEAQDVAPASGPELIETPVTRSTGAATVDAPTATVEGARGTYPTFETLADSPNARAGSPSKTYDYNGTPVEIRPVISSDGARRWAANFDLGGKRTGIARDSYAGLLDELPSILGGTPQSVPKGTISHIDADGVIHDMRGAKAPSAKPSANETALADVNKQIKENQALLKSANPDKMMVAAEKLKLLNVERDRLRDEIAIEKAAAPSTPRARRAAETEASASASANTAPNSPRNPGEAQTVAAADHAKAVDPKRKPMKPADRKKFPAVAKAEERYARLVKEDREGLPKEVSAILRKQQPGEHEFSPIYGGDRPIDRIVTEAIDSGDPTKLAQAEQFVTRLDEKVEQELRPDAFYQTWKNGGAPVYLQDDPRFTDAFFEQMRVLDPGADPKRLKTLANGLAKGVLDDIAMVQFQLNQVAPLIRELYPEASLDGLFGKVGRAASRDLKDESAAWLLREYLLTEDAGRADTILRNFLTNADELSIIADGVHKPYAHSVPAGHETESLARLLQMREQATAMKQAERLHASTLPEVSMAPFREPDVVAQFAGGNRGQSRSFAEKLRQAKIDTKHHVPTDEQVLAAIGEINDSQLRWFLLNGDGKLTVEMAQVGDRMLPATWMPPGGARKEAWNVREALDALTAYKQAHPEFDYHRARDEVAELGAGLTPKRTASEIASMRKAARAQGLDPKLITNGASSMERLTATRAVRALDAYLSYWRQLRLFNVVTALPNRIGDQIGNMSSIALRGDLGSVLRYLPETAKTTKTLRGAERDAQRTIEAMTVDSAILRETGQTLPTDLVPGRVINNEVERSGLPAYNDLLKDTPMAVRAAGNLATVPLLKDVTVAGELAGRKIVFEQMYQETLAREALPAFKEYLRATYPNEAEGMLAEINRVASEKGGRSYSGYFAPADVASVVDEKAASKWQGELNRASQKGKSEADRIFFNGKMTNADEIARRVFTFHYWMTRATALYGRTVLRNPALLNGFYRMWQRAADISREQGLPEWMSSMFRFYQSSSGMYAAFSPIGALFPTFVLDLQSEEGNKLQAFQNLLNPLLGGALGAAGLTQNIPDISGTRNIERFIADMGNFMKGEGVPLESVPFFGQYVNQDSLQLTIPTEEFTKLVLQKANDFLGEPLGTFAPFDRQANEEDQLYSMGEQIAVGLWGPDIQTWTPAQIQELTDAVHQAQYGDGDETWLSETIRATYGREGGARAGFSLLIPGGVVTRQQFRDDQIKAAGEYWDAFYSGQPTTKAGESAAIGRQLATSANPPWIAMNNAYYQIGTETQQTQYNAVNDMLYSPGDLNPKQSIIIDNGNGIYTIYSMGQLAGMSDKDRRTVVDAWVANNPGIADAVKTVKDGRDQFKTQHPDYAQYSEYQSAVFKYEGGTHQFRMDMQDNPTFKAAQEAARVDLKKEGKTGAVLEAELDHWATTQQAFFAATGQKYKRDDVVKGTPGPSSVAAMFSLRDDEQESNEGSKLTKGPDGKLYNDDGQLVNQQGKPINAAGELIDDYWAPTKGVPRLEQDQAQYAYDNAEMERRFGPYWNQSTADWENNADSAKERDNLGIGNKTYVLPGVSETMRRYEAWEEDHPGGSPEAFFEEMLQTEGFGRKSGKTTPALPGGTTISNPPGVAAYPTTAASQLQAVLQRLGMGR